jgi:hypothetical protein
MRLLLVFSYMKQEIELIDFQIINLLRQRRDKILQYSKEDLGLVKSFEELDSMLITPEKDFYSTMKKLNFTSEFSRKVFRILLLESRKLVKNAYDKTQFPKKKRGKKK